MGRVVVVSGPPGSGKSTVSEQLATLLAPTALVPGDAFFGFLRTGAVAPWLEEAEEQNAVVIEAAAACVGRLARRFEVVYDGVVGPWYLPTFIGGAGLGSVHYVVLLPPLDLCRQRVQERRLHGFADLDATEQMWDHFHRSSAGLGQHLIESPADPSHLAGLIAQRMTEGSLEYRSPQAGGRRADL